MLCAAALFLIESGEVTVTVRGNEGTRSAPVTAFQRSRLLGTDVLGLPPARRAERCDRLEPPPDSCEEAARRRASVLTTRRMDSRTEPVRDTVRSQLPAVE